MKTKFIKLYQAKSLRRVLSCLLFLFVLGAVADAYNSKTIGGEHHPPEHFKWRFPLHMFPHRDGMKLDQGSLTIRRDIFRGFKQEGMLSLHPRQGVVKEKIENVVRLGVYADETLIASWTDAPNESKVGKKRQEVLKFKIPPGTTTLKLKLSAGGATRNDFVFINDLSIFDVNMVGVFFFCLVLLLLLCCSVSCFRAEDFGQKTRIIYLKLACLFFNIGKCCSRLKMRGKFCFYPVVFLVLFLAYDSNMFRTAPPHKFENFQRDSEELVAYPISSNRTGGMGRDVESDKLGWVPEAREYRLPLESYMTPKKITNSDYHEGIHRKRAGVLLENNVINRRWNKEGATATFKDGSTRDVLRTEEDGKNLLVWFSGESLSSDLGYPYMYHTSATVDFSPYLSHAGLSARVFTGLAKLHPPVWLYNSLVAAFLALVLTGLAAVVAREFGFRYAVVFVMACILFEWLVMMGRNLYWVPALFFLPMLFMALHVRTGKRIWALLCFGALVVKFLNGFEYITTICIAMCVPLVYASAREQLPWGVFFKRIGICAGVALVAFLVSIVVTCSFEGSSFDYLFQRAIYRTVESDNEYGNSLGILNNFQTYLDDSLFRGVWIPMYVFFSISLFSAFLLAQSSNQRRKALGISTLFSVLAPLSWFFVARQHSHIHHHINYVLWGVPFIPMVFMTFIGIFEEWGDGLRGHLTQGAENPPSPQTLDTASPAACRPEGVGQNAGADSTEEAS